MIWRWKSWSWIGGGRLTIKQTCKQRRILKVILVNLYNNPFPCIFFGLYHFLILSINLGSAKHNGGNSTKVATLKISELPHGKQTIVIFSQVPGILWAANYWWKAVMAAADSKSGAMWLKHVLIMTQQQFQSSFLKSFGQIDVSIGQRFPSHSPGG